MAILLLLWLKLLVISSELQRSVWLSYGWRVNHAVFQWSTTGTTSSGSWHGALSFLFLSRLKSLHSSLLINGGASEVIV
jgi:hypothetical protein